MSELHWSHGRRTWFEVHGGDLAGIPLVICHGGPGMAHDYLDVLAQLADERPVLLYDQFGCGRSDHAPDADPASWTVDLFLEELVVLVEHLGWSEQHHLLGQSWGGMLGLEYALTAPAGLRSLVLSNSPASIRLWLAEANRLRADLPVDVQATLDRHERAGSTDSPEYAAAVDVFMRRHVCRMEPYPDGFTRSMAQFTQDPTVYLTMNGPSEFHIIGSLKDWDVTDRLGEIAVPTLLISGEFDEATAAVVQPIHDGIVGSEWSVIPGASHLPFQENPVPYFEVVRSFLGRHDLEPPRA
ncbi:MAG TPA: proline iminopeptidase-family hydrolase [Mycobacteriales bacterium]|jgi:L-proline amide hydrolase|nr:proline iminopeptidase-family hydrolase [Mycobacteriales bacterium]